MARQQQDELVFVALGGVGEIGMNMAAYGFGPERSRKWIVVDCGVTFGGPNQPGIELIMADPSFLEEIADDVLALILTHSHEDHYGGVLDLWPAFERPVYCKIVLGWDEEYSDEQLADLMTRLLGNKRLA